MSSSQLNNKIFSSDLGSVSQNNLSPEEFDRQLRRSLRKTYPPKKRISLAAADLGHQAAVPGTASTERAAREAGCPMLDTPTLECGKIVPRKACSTRFLTNRVSRRIFSRVMMGMNLPGRYYFLTLTSSPDSPPLEKSWDKLRKWLKSERSEISWIVVFTDEGHGVIHMVFRLPLKSKNIDVRLLRARWKKWHKAKQIVIKRAQSDHEKLADYLSDQRKMRKLGSEMSWQNSITRWGWSKGWIPKGFTTTFRQLWYQMIDVPDGLRKNEIRIMINRAHEAEKWDR